ncbi:MAG: nuclear transport factor 2 family protein [Pseudomonadota bacterium]
MLSGWEAVSLPNAKQLQAVRAAAHLWIEHFKSGDLDQLMTLYEPDAFIALHGQPAMRGIDEIRAYFESRIGRPGVKFDLDIEEIQIHGDVAHLVSKYWFELPLEDGGSYRDAGRSLLIYKNSKEHGWRIYLDLDQATPDVTWPTE